MDTPNTTLREYGATNAPSVAKIASAELGPRTVGYYCRDRANDQRVYVSERDPDEHRYHGEDPYYDFPFDGDGYGLSIELFARLHGRGIGRIYIVEEAGDVLHYSFSQFVNGTPINIEDEARGRGYEKDPQKVVPISDAVEVWEDHADSVWSKNSAFR